VVEILDDTRLLGKVLNSHKLGQRKNCNLPGVVSDLPVLGEKDIDDVKNFAAKHGMDYVFASFVQSADDVRMIRKVRGESKLSGRAINFSIDFSFLNSNNDGGA